MGRISPLSEQLSSFADIVDRWWYWDREGDLHEVNFCGEQKLAASAPFLLSQSQVDALVEASLPDHLLYYVGLNQPQLLHGISLSLRYQMVRNALERGYILGLEKMRDLVNYVCIELFYRGEVHMNERIVELLGRVKRKELSLDDAMQQLP